MRKAIPSQTHFPLIAKCLIIAALFTLGFLAIVSLPFASAAYSPQENNTPEADVGPAAPPHEKRLLGLGGVLGLVPSLLGTLVPGGIASSLAAQVTADINSLLPLLEDPTDRSPNGVTLTSSGQTLLPLTAQPMPTGAQLGALADKLGGLLNHVVPVAAPSIIAAITRKAHGVVTSVEAIATEVVSLGNQIGSDQIQAPDALSRIGELLTSLDSKVNDIVNDVTSDLTSELPLPILQDLQQAVSSGLGDIVGAANGPVSLIGDLIEQNACGVVTSIDGVLATVAGLCGDMSAAVAQVSSEVATASLTNSDATLTDYASSRSNRAPNSPTSMTSAPHVRGTSTTRNVVTTKPAHPGGSHVSQTTTTGVNGIITVTEYQVSTQQCESGVTLSTAMAGQTVTVTVQPSCSTKICPQASESICHCPSASPSPEGTGAQGPCPGAGYTCDDCLDGWFCPPSQTPAQPAPCGFGWPCAHCEGGWFCAPVLTPGLCSGSTAPMTSHPITSVVTKASSSRPSPAGSAASWPSPPPPEKVKGWSYCGCWADQIDQRALDTETVTLDLLTNEACVQHCMIRGFIMAGTEMSNTCLCGNFLNGTQKMDEEVCSMPCSGDATQRCGGLNALSCYSPDGQPYGWASAGPQPRAPTIRPPKVLALNIGGVAHTKITTPAIIFPPGNADPGKLTSKYGKIISQPLGDLPSDLTLSTSLNSQPSSTPPFGGSGVAPGRRTRSKQYPSSSSPIVSGPSDSLTDLSGNSGTPSVPVTTSSPSMPGSPGPPGSPTAPGTPGPPGSNVNSGTSSVPVIPGSPDTTNAPGSASSQGPGSNVNSATPSVPVTPSTPGSSDTGSRSTIGSLTSTPRVHITTGSSTNPNSNSGVAPGQGTRSTSTDNGEPSSTTSASATTPNPSASPTSSISSSVVTTSPSNPDESTLGASGTSSSTPEGAGGVAPGRGHGSSKTPGSKTPSSMPPGGSTPPPNSTPTGGPSLSTAQTEPTGSGQGPESSSTNMPSASESCVNGDCNTKGDTTNPSQGHASTSPVGGSTGPSTGPLGTGGNSNTEPGQTQATTSPSEGGNPPGPTSPHDGKSMTNNPSSSPPESGSLTKTPSSSSPITGGAVAPGHGKPSTSQSPSGSSNNCPPGSSDPSCISLNPSGSKSLEQSQSTESTPSNNPTTCAQGSNDPACTSPFGGGGVAPGHRQPSKSTSSGISSTCAAGSTDPSCNSSISGDTSASSHTQPTSLTSPMNPTGQTNQPSTISSSIVCTPGSTDPRCTTIIPNTSGTSGPKETSRPATLSISNSGTVSPASGNTPSRNGESSVPTGQGSVTSPKTNESGSLVTTSQGPSGPSSSLSANQATQSNSPSQGSTSTPNEASGVAPGHQSPGTQRTRSSISMSSLLTSPSSSSQTSATSNSPEISGGSATLPVTGSNTSSSNGATPSLNTPGLSTPSNPNQDGSVGPSSTSSGPQTSYAYPPGLVPYGDSSPSMTTLASMLAWREPNGEEGTASMLEPANIDDDLIPQQDAPTLDFEGPPTTATTFSKSADPRWQRIRPVYVW